MKNIHLIPTENSSTLSIDDNGSLIIHRNQWRKNTHYIYITSDEEINIETKPCWCVNTIKNTWNKDLIYYQGAMPQYHFIGFKKIILTTDPNLIKEGVQEIPDEFLKWFVKNPTCEKVEVVRANKCKIVGCDLECILFKTCENIYYGYEIIIPLEEIKYVHGKKFSKKELEEFKKWQAEMLKTEEEEEEEEQLGIPMGKLNMVVGRHKPETLEEAIERLPLQLDYSEFDGTSFELGVNWQQERSYSEEEVLEILDQHSEYLETFIYQYIDKNDMEENEEWFKQFKKK